MTSCRSLCSRTLVHLGPQLRPQILDGHLGLQDAGHTPAPRIGERRHLAGGLVLGAAAGDVEHVDLGLGVGEGLLEGAQLRLEGVVAEEPGVAAPLVEEAEVEQARGEVGVRGVGFAEGGGEGGGGGGWVVVWCGGEFWGFVAREVDGLEGFFARYPFEFGLDEGREVGFAEGGEVGGWEGGEFVCDFGFGGCALFLGWFGVDVWRFV